MQLRGHRKAKKWNFLTETIDHLGHLIRPRRSEIASHKTDTIKILKALRNVSELKMVLGLCNIFRRFVPNFARTSFSRKDTLRKDQSFHFKMNEKEIKAMNSFRGKLISALVLASPYAEGRVTLDEDACDIRFG